MTALRFALATLVALATSTRAQPAPPPKSEAEYLVPPQGGAYEVPLHAGAVCILSFPSKMAATALASSAGLEIKSWGDDGVAVRAASEKLGAVTVALATAGGQVKVNVTLRVVAKSQPAMTLVRFKPASAAEAFEAQVAAEVKKRMAPLEAELAKSRQSVDASRHEIDDQIRTRADGLIAERLLRRNELVKLTAHERNDDHVILHVVRGQLLGDDGYLVFELENRSSAAYRLATVRVLSGATEVSGPARLATTSVERDPSVVGVVPSGATARAIVVVRSVDTVLGKPLTFVVTGPDGRGEIRIDRLVLR